MTTTTTAPPTVGRRRSAAPRPTGRRGRSTWPRPAAARRALLPAAGHLGARRRVQERSELFSTFTFAPSTASARQHRRPSAYRDGLFWRWMANTALYAGVGALLSTVVSAHGRLRAGEVPVPGQAVIFNVILLAGVLVPGVILAVPQYLLLAKARPGQHLLGGAAAEHHQPVQHLPGPDLRRRRGPDELLEAARTDGAGEQRLFVRIAVPMMRPGW